MIVDQEDINVKKFLTDIKVFEYTFKKFYPVLVKYALKYLKDKDTAEEAVQEVFYTIWKKRKELNITSTLSGYLYKSVYNNCLRYLQHEEVKQRYSKKITDQKNELINRVSTPEEETRYNELKEKVDKSIKAMPDRCREVFELSRLEGLKYSEIAEKLSISVKTVEVHMGRALKHFRESLKLYINTQ